MTDHMVNIAELLKKAPYKTPLYSTVCGECRLECVSYSDDFTITIQYDLPGGGVSSMVLDKNGRMYFNGECVLFPSKKNRDWHTFHPKFEYKAGDVVKDDEGNLCCLVDTSDDIDDVAFYEIPLWRANNEGTLLTLATPEEIDSWNNKLHSKGIHYSKSKHSIIHWFNPKDDVLVRDCDKNEWTLCSFSHYDKTFEHHFCASGLHWKYCIPYYNETAKLLGTANDYIPTENNE